ncbi:hypothetical protein [Alistipes finegoldii]|uniref:hypothetical protein n=1 Tax=Alistipes finegoldii TaxID=214856 RepID=UPI0026754A58|nr:hypothetical protein [Alistipes finegoldii]
MNLTGAYRSSRKRGVRPEAEAKYGKAVELYGTTRLSCREISSICGVTSSGLRCHICKYHRDLMLTRYGISCDREQAANIRLGQLRGQLPATRIKYRDAIEACGSMEFIEFNVSQVARMFGLDGTGLARQLRTHCPEIIELREQTRLRLGLNDNLPRGMRKRCHERYARAVERLRGDSYVSMQEAARSCGVSYSGLLQHLRFYHKDLVVRRVEIRGKAVGRQCKGEITGRGTLHAPKPATVIKYAEALRLFRTTPLSAARIAAQTNVTKKGFYEYLQKWHMDLVCKRRGIAYEEGVPVDWSKTRKYNPATKAKYADGIRRLKESGLPTAAVAAEFGLHPEAFRQYLKEHEPELHARQGMMRASNGRSVSRRSMEKYAEALHLFETTGEELKSIARRLGLNYNSLGGFIRRNFPELILRRRQSTEQCGGDETERSAVPASLAI